MAGLITFSVAGLGFLAIAAVESLGPSLFSKVSFSLIRFASVAALSVVVILDALVSALVASHGASHDAIGAPLPLATAAAAALFLLYALAGLASILPSSAPLLPLPPSLLDLLLFAAFAQELALLSLRRKDPDGLENRYLDLLLTPALLCAAATLAALARPHHSAPRLARAAGLAFHGTWLIQMAFSFFSTAMAHGCVLYRRSPANYTIKCKGHADYHRSGAIATLQFNCHLALLVVVGVGIYSAVASRSHAVGDGPRYRPLSRELRKMDHISSHFTLDSDEEGDEIVADTNGTKQQHDFVTHVQGGPH